MSYQRSNGGPGGNAGIRDPQRKEQDMRGAAILHQQRRLKQATQFVHKDSADLLPLDQLRRLGTSKDLQPHCVIQRRLLGSPVKEPNSLAQPPDLRPEGIQPPPQSNQGTASPHLCNERSGSPQFWSEESQANKRRDQEIKLPQQCDKGSQPSHPCEDGLQSLYEGPPPTCPCKERSLTSHLCDEGSQPSIPCEETMGGWKEHTLLIPCKVFTQDVRAKLCIERQQNFISRSCAERLGLVVSNETTQKGLREELKVDIELGTERMKSKAVLIDDEITEFSLGLQTLVTLKSCIDLNQGVLKTPFQEISFLNPLKRECIKGETAAATDRPLQGSRREH
ncbi:nuclear receptor-interacting protein 2 [Discoglossus pictus]